MINYEDYHENSMADSKSSLAVTGPMDEISNDFNDSETCLWWYPCKVIYNFCKNLCGFVLRDNKEHSSADEILIRHSKLPLIWVLAGHGAPIECVLNRIAQHNNFYHISVGQLVKNELISGTYKPYVVDELMKRGVLFPRPFLMELIKSTMARCIRQGDIKGFILSGYPMTYRQAKDFISHVQPVDFGIFLKVNDKTMWLAAYQELKSQTLHSWRNLKTQEQLKSESEAISKTYCKEVRKINRLLNNNLRVLDGQAEFPELFYQLQLYIQRSLALNSNNYTYSSEEDEKNMQESGDAGCERNEQNKDV